MTRNLPITEKIPKEKMEFRGSFFVHVVYSDDGRPIAVRFSHKGKEKTPLDSLLTALGDTITNIIGD